MSVDIGQLTQDRQEFVKALQKNNFETGLRQLLTDLYPDNAHFIYELLQNAEDARATVVRFALDGLSGLDFEHDGKRLFSLADVDAITSIGISTKRDDPTSIGKFGVGFKAVFAYTKTPEIHSGDFHFRICDLVVPETEGVTRRKISEQTTLFVFPFDHPKKPAQQAVREITDALKALGDNTLLFLKSIRKIEYLLPNGELGYLERVEHGNGRIEICALRPGGENAVSHWLRFDKDVEVEDDNGETKKCRIAIAYSLAKEEGKESAERIVPPERGQVSIYFPAVKETSNLHFHLHAPFASTVARDSVRNCPANDRLRDHLAELVVESLVAIRDQQLLTVGSLAVMPIPADNLRPFYEPIRVAVVSAFVHQRLTPTKSKTHEAAKALYRGPARISEVLDDKDLSVLTERESRQWVANPPPQSQRGEHFLESLDMEKWEWRELARAMSFSRYPSDWDELRRKRVECWISQKDDAWLMRFYALLGEACDSHGEFAYGHNCRVVRVVTVGGDDHVAPSEAFFPSADGAPQPPDIRFVKPAVYDVGRSEAQKKTARSFLEHIGVRPFDIKANIERRLDFYDTTPAQIPDVHFGDLELFLSYWEKHDGEASLFANHAFLIGAALDGGLSWRKPAELYLDAPYLETGLAELASIHKKYALWSGYEAKLGSPQLGKLLDFLRAVGAMHELAIIAAPVHENPNFAELFRGMSGKTSSNRISTDYSIQALEAYLKKPSIVSSRLIWQALTKAGPQVAKAKYRLNAQHQTREVDSQLVYHLRNHAWIPDKSGEFRKPQDMTKNALQEDFLYDDRNDLLTAIGFGENDRKRSEEYQSQDHAALKLGFASCEEAEEALELAKLCKETGFTLARIRSTLLRDPKKPRPEFPKKPSTDPNRREVQLVAQMNNAPPKEYAPREIVVRVSRDTIDPTEWLRNQYKNAKDQMICQICKEEMPFRKRDGEHYFEAVEVLSKDDLPKEHEAQYLALCPLCAAKYKELVKKDKDALKRFQSALVASEEAEVPLLLGTELTSVGFVETHWKGIKTIVKKAG